jgi:poly(3-hydroxybutyrate) depolymerase
MDHEDLRRLENQTETLPGIGRVRHGREAWATGRRRASRRALLAAPALVAALLGAPALAAAQPALVLTPPATVVGVGGPMQYSAVYYPYGVNGSPPQYLDPADVTWSSSDPNILDVSGGITTGRNPGTATLTAQAQHLGLVAQTLVTVAGAVTSSSLVTPDSRTRTYSLYVPDDVGTTSAPLVIVYHGAGGSGMTIMQLTLMNAVAHQNRFLVAYPDGLGSETEHTGWNGGGNGGYAADNHIDDVEFTRRLIDDIASRVNVDRARVYATGISNGAVFTHRLGFELADRIAAIAPVSGPLVPGGDFVPTSPIRPVPVIEFHGTTDQSAQYFPSIPETVDMWLARDEIPLSSRVVSYGHGIETCESYSTAAAEVTLCTADPPLKFEVGGVLYDGGGHAWPGGERGGGTQGSDIPTPDINASATIWQFFTRAGGFQSSSPGLVSAVLPSSRSVMVGTAASAFVTVINAGQVTATNVGISVVTPMPATFSFQTTDPATNKLTGTPNTPVDIAAGQGQTYVISFTPTAPFVPTDATLDYAGTNTQPMVTLTGLNTLLLSSSVTPVPDVVALAATLANDGIVNIPGPTGTGIFSLATTNLGASGSITVAADTGGASLPVSVTLCQTKPATGQCLSAIESSVTTQSAEGAALTFAVFVSGSASVPFDPAANRIFVRFRDSGGTVRGATSVAVRTQ